jgi:hypothetical protein
MKRVLSYNDFIKESFGSHNFMCDMKQLQLPEVMYHETSPANRESILRDGLKTEYSQAHEAIYFSTHRPTSEGFDTWVVYSKDLDVRNVSVDSDMQVVEMENEGEVWYAHYADITPELLTLIPAKK